MAINNTLKDIREERNLIQADLAEAIGSCSQTIGRIERGERNPSLEIAIRLAHYLKVPVEDAGDVQLMTTSHCEQNISTCFGINTSICIISIFSVENSSFKH